MSVPPATIDTDSEGLSDHLTAAEALLTQLRQRALIGEAEDLGREARHLSVVTGDFET